MAAGALIWLCGEVWAAIVKPSDTTSAWVWLFESKTRWWGRAAVLLILIDLILHLVFHERLFHPWSSW